MRKRLAVLVLGSIWFGDAANSAPVVLDPALNVTTIVGGLNQPTSIAFLAPNDMLVLEKSSGRVLRVVNGAIQSVVLDLAVNSATERGLLGIALQPNFATTGGVYLHWSESTTGADSVARGEVPLLGNRVDRFVWDGANLTFDTNIARLRALQTEISPTSGLTLANNNGGVLRFGPDGKLYVAVGDVGRRGWTQNLANGPTGGADDAFGGPAPDNAHLTGVVLRLNPDGSAPSDNPFFAAGAALGGQVGANIQKTFSYGIRNSFGMAFDPVAGGLWLVDNGDDAFDEINRVFPGMNGGWVQTMGPVDRIEQYKQIETTFGAGTLQQTRWPPSNIADNPVDALARLFTLPGATYSDPEFSWKFNVAPAALGFLDGDALGAMYDGNMFVGAGGTLLEDGYLFRFVPDASRTGLAFFDPSLADLVADNLDKFDGTESESLLFGTGFGIGTDIQTGPDGSLYIVSLSNGAIYKISRVAADVTEPATAGLLGTALAALWLGRRRREG